MTQDVVLAQAELLTLAETARAMKVSRYRLRQLIREEGLPVVRLGERTVRVPPHGLADWIRRRAES